MEYAEFLLNFRFVQYSVRTLSCWLPLPGGYEFAEANAKPVQKNLTIFLRYFHRKQLKVPPYVETFNCPASDARVVRYDLIRGLHPRAPAVSYCMYVI